jgi:membrane associated rhomboid family serine protease
MSDPSADTAPCSKCGTTISTAVERCPACGYEPGSSIIAKGIFYLFAAPFTTLFGLLIIAAVAGGITGGMAVSDAVVGAIASAVMGLVPFWYFRRYRHRRRIGPTE